MIISEGLVAIVNKKKGILNYSIVALALNICSHSVPNSCQHRGSYLKKC